MSFAVFLLVLFPEKYLKRIDIRSSVRVW
jgi:hypothetical protein